MGKGHSERERKKADRERERVLSILCSFYF